MTEGSEAARNEEQHAPPPWAERDMAGAYVELDHPADIFLEVRGNDLPELFENGLFAFYAQVSDLEPAEGTATAGGDPGAAGGERTDIEVRADSPAEAFRALLSEALYRFDTEGLVARAARVEVQRGGAAATTEGMEPEACTAEPAGEEPGDSGQRGTKPSDSGQRGAEPGDANLLVKASLWGGRPERRPGALLAEVKAITYHRLAVCRTTEGVWKATVLLDV